MKKYNIKNYVRYKEDVKECMPDEEFAYIELPRDKLIIKFLPLVENIARKFSTTQQASGVMSINDLIQEGSSGLTKAVDRLDWTMLDESEDIEKTLKSFLSKRIKGAIRRAIDKNRARKIIFDEFCGLDKSAKMTIVGKMVGRSKIIRADDVYETMLDIHDNEDKITWKKVASVLKCSERTVLRNIDNELKKEKELLNQNNEKI